MSPEITKRHKKVIALVAAGEKNATIAAALNVTEHVIKNDLRMIYDNLGLWNRVELALWYVKRHAPIAALLLLLTAVASATVGQHSVTLTWTESDPTAISFNIYKGTAPGVCSGTPVRYDNTANKTYVDTSVTAGTTYYYAVSALNSAGGESTCSNEVQAPVPTAPVQPTNLQGIAK